MSKRQHVRKKVEDQPEVQPVSKDKRDMILAAFANAELIVQDFATKNDKADLIDSLNSVRKKLLGEENKKVLRALQREIAAAIRNLPSALKPRFERLRFFLWVTDNIPDARDKLPLLDDVGWCPDSFMSSIESHYKDPNFGYKTFGRDG